jgi:hypothetical protein
MATGRIGVSLSELQRIAAQLDETAAWLSSGTVLAGAPGAEPYDEVISAIGEFDEDWERAMTHLRDATADLGAKVAATGQLVAEHDTAAAESVRKLTGLLHSLRLEPVEA